MNISEAIKTLDGVIPSSDNKMVDFEQIVGFEHFFIAIAWETVKTEIERLKKEVDYWEYETKVAREEIDNAGKETARKILNELIDSSNKITFFDCRMALGLDKLAKRYGVEVENDR